MSNNSLIINARHQMPWRRRLFSDATTAMLWGCWLWLWRPVLSAFNWLAGFGASFTNFIVHFHSALPKIINGSGLGFEGGVVTLVGTSGTLLLWNLLPARKVSMPEVQTLRDYARHFDLPEQTILAGRAASVCVVHHDDNGHIIGIEACH